MKMPAMSSTLSDSLGDAVDGVVGVDWLWAQLRGVDAAAAAAGATSSQASVSPITLLDCRSAADFGQCHIRRAVHLSLPSIMLRRLAGGKVTIGSVLKSSSSTGGGVVQQHNNHTFVLCGGAGEMMSVLRKSLMQDGCPVVCLQGGVEEFRNKYPEWCVMRESETSSSSTDGLPNLRLCSSGSSGGRGRPGSLGSRSASDSEEDRPDSSSTRAGGVDRVDGAPPAFGSGFSLGLSVGLRLGLESEPLPPLMLDNVDVAPSAVNGGGGSTICTGGPDTSDPFSDPGFPVEIMPFLFLGNAQNSRDCDALDKHCIRYVVNVTPNLPNVFEDSGTIQYLQIPITDHWSQNLASFFPAAIHFIDTARERQEGVLVHCLAGISRSVTITVAYLMYKMSMSLNDAYDFVRRKKSNISPNFNFMGQLLDFERQLNPPSPQRCTCHLSSSSLPTAAPGSEDAEKLALIPFMRLSIEEKDGEENIESMSPSTESTLLPGGADSGVPSSVSLSPSSLASSPAANSTISSSGGSGVKRLRTLVCRCQASLSQCHFTTPTTTASPYPNP